MAEVFGVVVSALTVADMASKLGASIFKLSRLWEEVKDAPEDISERIMQLAIMKPVLEETEARLRNDDDGQHGIRHSSTADASVEYCRQAVNKLDLLAKDLQERISKAKTTRGKLKAQFQVPLKKDVLQRYDKQIKFALEMLALSQQTYIIALVKNNSSVRPQVHQIMAEDGRSQRTESTNRVRDTIDTPPIDTCRPKSNSLAWLNPSVFGGFTYVTSDHEKDSSIPVYKARLQLPWWLSNKVWDLQVHSACQGWKFSILPWITRPQDAPIFHLVKRGSWADVLDAFNQNQASLRDRDSDGNTLLHWAASYGNLDVFINLIKLGLSTEETTAQGSSALQLLWLMERSTEEAVNVIKLLTLNGSLDEYLLYLFPRTGKFTANALTSRENSIRLKLSTLVWYFPGVLQIMASELQIDPLQLPPDARFTSLNWRCADPDIFLDEVGRGEAWDAASFRAILCGPDNNNLHTFARAYFYGVQALAFENCLFCTSFRKESKIESWRELARRIFSAASLEALIQCRSVSVNPRGTLSPFFDGLFSLNLHFQEFDVTNREWRRRISRAMVMWLEDVRSSGIDLDEYGAAIRKLYLDNAWLQTERWGSKWVGNVKYKESGPRLVGLTIGPMPEDWKLHWDMDEDEFAGEFWELVENPPLRIPGGWVDE